MVYRIRAHHGMCFSFFQGKGYSGEFTENMHPVRQQPPGDMRRLPVDRALRFIITGCRLPALLS